MSSAFAALGLRSEIVETLTSLGYEAPTPIQERTIPLLLSGKDIIGQAQTGTGKTAAFALPILEKIDPKLKKTQALILAPTRELAMQVAEAFHSYASKLEHVTVIPVYGGAPIVPQLKRLERGAHIVVGTPGRLIDHLDRGSLDLSHIRVVVLDEADEMLKMGFIEDMEKILSALPAERQTALFSATMQDEVLRIAKRHLRSPERVEIEHKTLSAPAIEQRFLNVSEGQKLEVLTQILELEPAEAVLVFRRTKTGSADLAEKLEARGFAAVAMHGDMSQPLREAVIRRLRAGQVEIVVATDVAARGLDVEQIEHVVNYDVPYDVEAYVHRIGRTGRAGRSGVATMFITPRERRMMREIERFTGSPIKPMKLPSRADVAAKRIAVFKENLRKNIQEGDLDMYLELVEQVAEEGFDIAEIAAAAARIANGSKALVKAREQERDAIESPGARVAEAYAEARGGGMSRRASDDRQSGFDDQGAPRGADKTVRLSMAVGRQDGIRPADIVGSIANEADVPGREIGPIEILDDVTYVGIPERYVEVVLAKVAKKKFRGRTLNIRVARDDEQQQRPRPRRDAGPPKREFSGPKREYSGPKREFSGPKRESSGPKREYSGPKREYSGPKREYSGPKREYSGPKRDASERPPRRETSERPRREPAGRPRQEGERPRFPTSPFDRFGKKKKRF